MKVTGVIEFRDLEGGVFELRADDGKRYALSGSKSELRKAQGARVEIDGLLDEGFGLAMTGPQLRVSSVRRL